jgi:hypothetical protein
MPLFWHGIVYIGTYDLSFLSTQESLSCIISISFSWYQSNKKRKNFISDQELE